jgi:Tfp pilus assembly protein FimT
MRRCLLVTGRAAPQRPGAPAPGSTLLELIVVLVILGLVFGLAIPVMTALPERSSVRSPTDTLRLVAVAEGRLVRGDSVVALPDGRLIARRGSDAE